MSDRRPTCMVANCGRSQGLGTWMVVNIPQLGWNREGVATETDAMQVTGPVCELHWFGNLRLSDDIKVGEGSS